MTIPQRDRVQLEEEMAEYYKAIRTCDLAPGPKVVLWALFEMDYNLEGGGRKGYSYYSAEGISKYLGGNPSPRSVQRHLKTLEERGYLTQEWDREKIHRAKHKLINYDGLTAVVTTKRRSHLRQNVIEGYDRMSSRARQNGTLNPRREIPEINPIKKSPERPQNGRSSFDEDEEAKAAVRRLRQQLAGSLG